MILSGFQFRASRKALNLTLTQLHQNTGILKGVLSRLENTTSNLEDIVCYAKDAETLSNYFSNHSILFPNKNTIALDRFIEPKSNNDHLTRFQFIVARTASNLSQRELGKYLNLSHTSLYQFECKDNIEYVHSYKTQISFIINQFNKLGTFFPNNLSVVLI